MILADQIESRVYVTGMDTKVEGVDSSKVSSRQKRDSNISGKPENKN